VPCGARSSLLTGARSGAGCDAIGDVGAAALAEGVKASKSLTTLALDGARWPHAAAGSATRTSLGTFVGAGARVGYAGAAALVAIPECLRVNAVAKIEVRAAALDANVVGITLSQKSPALVNRVSARHSWIPRCVCVCAVLGISLSAADRYGCESRAWSLALFYACGPADTASDGGLNGAFTASVFF
jgi:hypothetical protein